MKNIGLIKIIILIFASLTLLSCGEAEGDSEDVSLTLTPETPKVINNSFTIDPTPGDSDSGDELDVDGPWFNFRISGTNGATRKLTIAGYVLTLTGKDDQGNDLSPSEHTPDLGSDTDRQFIAEVAIGAAFNPNIVFYVDGLADARDRKFNAEIVFDGFFSNPDDNSTPNFDESTVPVENFEKTIRFTTQ